MFPGCKDLVHSVNRRIIAFSGELNIHDKITDIGKYLTVLFCAHGFFSSSCQSSEVHRKYVILLFFTFGVLRPRELSECLTSSRYKVVELEITLGAMNFFYYTVSFFRSTCPPWDVGRGHLSSILPEGLNSSRVKFFSQERSLRTSGSITRSYFSWTTQWPLHFSFLMLFSLIQKATSISTC